MKEFETGPTSFGWPDCPAYWSLDPTGTERLGAETAICFGFPTIQLITEVEGCFWNAGVYAGLRKFKEGNGFDPGSEDVARHLRYPLYQVSIEMAVPFAHGKANRGPGSFMRTNRLK